MTGPRLERAGRFWPRLSGLLACLVVCVAAVFLLVDSSVPPLDGPLRLGLEFPAGTAGKVEPLIATGRHGAGDFFAVRYLTPTTAQFFYDSWAEGGPASSIFEISPGQRRSLELLMPALSAPRKSGKGLLHVRLDGEDILHGTVHFHPRKTHEIHFAENPVGGDMGGLRFGGRILAVDGTELRGGPAVYFSWPQRFYHLATSQPLTVLCWVGAAGLAYFLGVTSRIAAALAAVRQAFRSKPRAIPQRPLHWAAAGTIAACTLAFSFFVTYGTFEFVAEESFASFYDHQARSLLHGRLDVPEPALSGEAFVYKGKVYGYFGPTPAVLRLPFAAMDAGMGKLSRLYLVAYYVLALAAAYMIALRFAALGGEPGSRLSRSAIVAFLTACGVGSTLFFLGSRSYVYHEAILCGAMFAMWSVYHALGYLVTGFARTALAALACGTAAVHARPPCGLFALAFLGAVALLHVIRCIRMRNPGAATAPIAIGIASVIGVFSFNALSYLKFGTFEGCPLRYHVQYDPARLARIENKLFHPGNVPFGAAAYVTSSFPKFDSRFPFIHFGSGPMPGREAAKLDLVEPLVGIPWAMPALSLLAVCGSLAAGGNWRRAYVCAWGAALPVALAMFSAIAVSHRYTSDFIPFLVVASAAGLSWLDLRISRVHRTLKVCVCILVAASACTTLALTAEFQSEIVWGAPEHVQKNYRAIRAKLEAILGGQPPSG
ncbi:MAG: hypothetical protein V4773_10285 [Verrucomicrobiota bacterium]